MPTKLSKKQINFLRSLSYVSGYELKDLMSSDTDIEVLLDPYDLILYNQIKE